MGRNNLLELFKSGHSISFSYCFVDDYHFDGSLDVYWNSPHQDLIFTHIPSRPHTSNNRVIEFWRMSDIWSCITFSKSEACKPQYSHHSVVKCCISQNNKEKSSQNIANIGQCCSGCTKLCTRGRRENAYYLLNIRYDVWGYAYNPDYYDMPQAAKIMSFTFIQTRSRSRSVLYACIKSCICLRVCWYGNDFASSATNYIHKFICVCVISLWKKARAILDPIIAVAVPIVITTAAQVRCASVRRRRVQNEWTWIYII